jgi:site-specific DNA-methyltransferase (adenine-specific)
MTTPATMNVEMVAISDLKPHPGNPRLHPDSAINKLVKSIKEFTFTNPVLLSADGIVLAGHARLKAAEKAGLTEVPVIRLPLSGAKADAYMIADNRLQDETEWDLVALKDILSILDTGELDLELTGFDLEEIEDMMTAEHKGGLTKDDAVPDEAPAVCQPGDLWLLGDHRLLCGDSTKAEDVARLMDGQKAVCMWTDPPYGVSYTGGTKRRLTIANDAAGDTATMLSKAWGLATDALEPGAPFYCARPPGEHAVIFNDSVVAAGWKFHEELQWVKDSMVLGHSDYHVRHETIIYGWTRGRGRSGRGDHEGTRWYGDNAQTTVFEVARPKRSEAHPTMKPVELVQAQLENSTPAGGIVLDPFLGSGSTLIACEKLGRKCYGMEIDPHYCDVIVKRWEEYTGKAAEKME